MVNKRNIQDTIESATEFIDALLESETGSFHKEYTIAEVERLREHLNDCWEQLENGES